jgi:uncharacterized protein (DUF488 family)
VAKVVYTIGHSNSTLEAITEVLTNHGIELVVDVRAYPRSRRYPHFNRQSVASHFNLANIQYSWEGKSLGGYRKPALNSPNTALIDANFKGFADHMLTQTFSQALKPLCKLATGKRLAIMCSEADYRHCHRQFIADVLSLAHFQVRHLKTTGEQIEHQFHPCLNTDSNPPHYDRMLQRDLFT